MNNLDEDPVAQSATGVTDEPSVCKTEFLYSRCAIEQRASLLFAFESEGKTTESQPLFEITASTCRPISCDLIPDFPTVMLLPLHRYGAGFSLL
ncbi:hypothetical protein JG687_00011682 [Phytophthora cactorum]|uniref:Uncharacterized protein n=1 Tax=Phytophthora cactorum TaxID=29920 RepID=A0A8T1U933_9STRA|nr:hypothetical protein JG687_00011682 [Phytophthora cactorum]